MTVYKRFREKGSDYAKVVSTTVIKEPSTRKEGYHNFLRSAHWQDLRKKRFKKDKKCYICLTKKGLQIHHNGYKHAYKGKMASALKNTYVLCGGCHGAVHKIQKERGLKWEQTKPVIEELKEQAVESRRSFREEEYNFSNMAKNF